MLIALHDVDFAGFGLTFPVLLFLYSALPQCVLTMSRHSFVAQLPRSSVLSFAILFVAVAFQSFDVIASTIFFVLIGCFSGVASVSSLLGLPLLTG